MEYYMYFRYVILQYMLTKFGPAQMSCQVNENIITNVKTKNVNYFIINAIYTGDL